MNRRVDSNHALAHAIELANRHNLPLTVYEGLTCSYPFANDRMHTFILEGVEENAKRIRALGAGYVFYLRRRSSDSNHAFYDAARRAAAVVTDDYPVFVAAHHNPIASRKVDCPYMVVDSSCVVPMQKLEKREYAAYTIRPKIRKLLPEYLNPLETPKLRKKSEGRPFPELHTEVRGDDIPNLVASCEIDHSVKPSEIYKGGTANGRKRLKKFVVEILPGYETARNKPDRDGSSRLSSYLHFGFLSALEIALAVQGADAPQPAKDAYLEELIVRRELSYNFTSHNAKYDSLDSLPDWAHKTMREHAGDERKIIYSLEQLEAGETHDELWNASQREMTVTGEMHNYVRMLWGKNVIAWTKSYEEAFAILEHLNNKYCLDGRNPNSYAGILWCFGKHDRPWMTRPVFGTMRYMTTGSTGKKFDSKKYIEWTKSL